MNNEAGWKEKREEISFHHLYPPPSSTRPKTNKQTKQVRLQNFKISHSMSRSPRLPVQQEMDWKVNPSSDVVTVWRL